MIAFVSGLLLLVGGYFVYGRLTESAVRPDPNRITPAIARADGVDYVAMSTWRVYLVQLLNIAGLGPVFGPILGALWGPQVFLWVVLGCIFGGAVHDLLVGAMSIRNDGAGLPDLIGHYLGKAAKHFSTFFILLLMLLVGTVFVKGPALLLVELLPAETVGSWFGPAASSWLESSVAGLSVWLWIVMLVIYVYYVLATLLPIDVLIGRLYPIFALALLVMVAGLGFSLLSGKIPMRPFTLSNLHPEQLPAWPLIFITVSCGAVSGFHATQSPLMARCLNNEKHMRFVFYGAMISEGVIALIWAAAGLGLLRRQRKTRGGSRRRGARRSGPRHLHGNDGAVRGNSRRPGRGGAADHLRRYRVPRRPADSGRLLSRSSSEVPQPLRAGCSAVWVVAGVELRRLRHHLEVLRLGQSGSGCGGPVDGGRFSRPPRQPLVARLPSSRIHDDCHRQLHPGRGCRLRAQPNIGHNTRYCRRSCGCCDLPLDAPEAGTGNRQASGHRTPHRG